MGIPVLPRPVVSPEFFPHIKKSFGIFAAQLWMATRMIIHYIREKYEKDFDNYGCMPVQCGKFCPNLHCP
jgi:hypothetical protein